MFTLLLLACRPSVPLSEVPIEGGTAEQRADVRTGLLAFDEAAGSGRVTLRTIRIGQLDGYAGSYDHFYRRIDLDEDTTNFTFVLRHELCHALVEAEELLDPVPAVIAEARDGLFSSVRNPNGSGGYDTEDFETETVANFCESGPSGAASAASVIDGGPLDADPELRRRLGAWLLDEIWQGQPPLPPLLLDPADVIASEAATTELRPTEDPSVVADLFDGRTFDLYTGAAVAADLPAVGSEESVAPGLAGAYYDDDGGSRVGIAGGTSAFIVTWDLYHLGSLSAFLANPGDGWRLVGDGSAHLPRTVFTADGEVWTSWMEDGTVLWTSLPGR